MGFDETRGDLSRLLKLVTYNEAQDIIGKSIGSLGHENIRSQDALWRILAEDILVAQDQPTFDKAAVDGYSINSSTTNSAKATTPIRYEIIGEIFPDDQTARKKIRHNQTMYVACGAPIPDGADSVIKAELVKKHGNSIEVLSPMIYGKNISRKGEDFKIETKLFSAYHALRPQDVGALLAAGCRLVKVLKKPVAGVLSVGSELTDARNPLEGRMVNDHAYVLLGFLQEFGIETTNMGVCPDEENEIGERLRAGLRQCDLVITLGGTSVGKRDLVPRAIMNLSSARELFHGMRMSPGKVNGLMMVDNKPVIILAGHIVTAVAGFFTIVVPILQRMQNMAEKELTNPIKAKLDSDVKTKPGTVRFLIARLKRTKGQLIATPFGLETNLLSILVSADAYAVIDSDSKPIAGETLVFRSLNPSFEL